MEKRINTTIVTCLFYIGRDRWKYSGFPKNYDRYSGWMKNFLSIDAQMIFYVDDFYYERAVEIRKKYDPNLEKTTFIKTTIGDLEAYKTYYNKMSSLMNSPEFKSKIQFQVSDMLYPLYNVLMYNKCNFIKEAAEMNPYNSEYFYWVDLGACRNESSDYERVHWPDSSNQDYFNNKITFFSHSGPGFDIGDQETHFLSQSRFIQGGYFIVPINKVNFLKREVESVIEETLAKGYIGSDEKIFDLIYKRNSSEFNIIQSSWFEFFKMCAPKTGHSKSYNRLKELSNDNIPEAHLQYLQKLKDEYGFIPKVIYDVGACVLNWTNGAKRIWSESEYILFEAMEESEEIFKETPYQYEIAVLSDQNDKEVTFYKNADYPWGNSYYMENPELSPRANELFGQSQNQFTRLTKTLDSIRQNRNFPYPDLLKIDVQGCEVDILKGAADVLQNVEHLIVELQHVPYNIGAQLENESIPFIESLGFELVTPRFSENVADADYHFKRKR